MKATVLLAALSMILGSSLASADDSFVRMVRCEGETIARPSNQRVKVQFLLNTQHQQDEGRILNAHQVTIVKRSKPETSYHPHFNNDCHRKDNKVTCSGHGIGTGDYEFKITLDLDWMRASGVYKETRYINPDYNLEATFAGTNLLRCVYQ